MSSASAPQRTHSGIVTFAGVMFLIAGAFNIIDGIAALANDNYFKADELLFGDLSAWGVWWLFTGALLLLTGWLVMTRRIMGIVLGVSIAGINAITQLMFIKAYPAWSIAAMVVDGLIIYALTTNVDDFA